MTSTPVRSSAEDEGCDVDLADIARLEILPSLERRAAERLESVRILARRIGADLGWVVGTTGPN